MDHMRFDLAGSQPARQPKSVAARFKSNRDAVDRPPRLYRLRAPAMQQREQQLFARLQLLAWPSLDARDDRADQPTRLAHLDHGNQCAILIQSGERSAQVV